MKTFINIFFVLLIVFLFACKKKDLDTMANVTVWNYYANRGEPNVKVALKERNNSYGNSGSGVNNQESILQNGYTDANGYFSFNTFKAKQNNSNSDNYEYVISITELYGKTITQSAIGGTKLAIGTGQDISIPIYINGTLNLSIINNPPQGGNDTIQVIFKNPNDNKGYKDGIIFQTSYGSFYPGLVPMGPYNVTIKKYKAGMYSETFDSIYINANATTSYSIVF